MPDAREMLGVHPDSVVRASQPSWDATRYALTGPGRVAPVPTPASASEGLSR